MRFGESSEAERGAQADQTQILRRQASCDLQTGRLPGDVVRHAQTCLPDWDAATGHCWPRLTTFDHVVQAGREVLRPKDEAARPIRPQSRTVDRRNKQVTSDAWPGIHSTKRTVVGYVTAVDMRRRGTRRVQGRGVRRCIWTASGSGGGLHRQTVWRKRDPCCGEERDEMEVIRRPVVPGGAERSVDWANTIVVV